MTLREMWKRIITAQHTRALEASAHMELDLRAEVARQCAEINRLRAENRALLNSILGIAGVPPLPVDHGTFVAPQLYPERAAQTESVGAQHAAPVDSAPPYTPVIPRPRFSAAEESAVGSEIQKQIPARPCLSGRQAAGGPRRPQDGLSRVRFQDSGGVHRTPETGDDSVVSDGTGSPSSFDGRSMLRPYENNPAPRAGATSSATIAVPMRRRSWQQINRMLEFDSARKKEPEMSS